MQKVLFKTFMLLIQNLGTSTVSSTRQSEVTELFKAISTIKPQPIVAGDFNFSLRPPPPDESDLSSIIQMAYKLSDPTLFKNKNWIIKPIGRTMSRIQQNTFNYRLGNFTGNIRNAW